MNHRGDPSSTQRARRLRRWLVAGYVLALALLVAVTGYGAVESRRAEAARDRVTHTLLVLQHALELENAALAMEASHRGHLVTGDDGFRQRRDDHYQTTLAQGQRLSELVRDNPTQSRRNRQVLAAVQARHDRMEATSALIGTEGLAAARSKFQATGDGSIDPIRAALRDIRIEEQRLLDLRSAVSTRNASRLDRVLVYGTGLAFVLLAGAGLLLMRQLVRTERIRVRLLESSERLEFTYDASRIGAWDADLASGTLEASPLMGELFGRDSGPTSAAAAWPIAELMAAVHAEDREPLSSALQAARASDEDWGRECRIRRPDGSQRWIWICGRALDYVNGEPQRMLGTVTDITDRKRTEEELESMFRQSRDMIGIFSFEGVFLRVNPAWTRALGYPEHDLVGQPFIDFVHPDDRDATLAQAESLAQGQETVLFENRYRTRDGDCRWLHWNVVPSPENRITYAVARDITERKNDERRIAALNHDLVERTRALETSNRELEAFSYSVSHDLRAPLRHIDGYARILIEDIGDTLTAEPRRYLHTITESARRMGQLIDDLLSLSRLGRKALVRDVVDMHGLATEAWGEAGTTQAQVEWGELPQAHGDRNLLKQVWINLLSNAVKYSAPRGVEGRISVRGERLAGGGVAYTVTDNGVGFDMRYAGKLFGVFQRLHAQDQFEGTGVGLAITHRILSRHGGNIQATAEPDRGASFRFELPPQESA